MADPREALAELLNQHEIGTYYGGWSCRCGADGTVDYIDHLTDVITAEHLVISRADIATEYGWQCFHGGEWETFETEGRQQALDSAAYQRDSEGAEWPTHARAVEHLTTAWSPIPLPENGDSGI